MNIRRFLLKNFFNLILFGVIIAGVNNSFAEDSAKPPQIQQSQLQKILDHWRSGMGIPDASLSIYLPEHDLPVTFTSGVNISPNTLFQAGSITKSFTATIILTLEAQGKLNIDDCITKYLPQYPQWHQVTIRQLLNHTSGIFNYTETGAFHEIRKKTPQATFTPAQIVQMASRHGAYFPPGKGWKYSNTNYVLAGMIISSVTGKAVDQVMSSMLHDVHSGVNLTHTYYLSELYSNDFLSRLARGYSSDGMDVTTDNMSWANTAGAIVTTTQDLLLWWRALFQGNLLPPKQMTQMMSLVCEHTDHTCTAGQPMQHLADHAVGKGYGLGIIQSAYGSERIGSVWWHNGTTKGYKAIVLWYPKSNIYLALTVNRNIGDFLKPNLSIIQNVLNILIPNAQWHITHPSHKRHKKNTLNKQNKILKQHKKHKKYKKHEA